MSKQEVLKSSVNNTKLTGYPKAAEGEPQLPNDHVAVFGKSEQPQWVITPRLKNKLQPY